MINDQQLLMYYYEDGLSLSEREQIRSHLTADVDLSARYQRLLGELRGLGSPAPVQPNPAAQARWRASLTRAAQSQAKDGPGRIWPLALVGATLVLLGVAIGTRIAEQSLAPQPAPIVAAADSDSGDASLARGLGSHFGDARLLLADLPSADPAQRRALIADILEQNRLYQRAAQAQGDDGLVRVLRALEPVLLTLADDAGGSEDARSTRAQLDFELAVMQTKLSRSPSKTVQSL